MEEKITIAICAGTTCYMMGGAELLTLEEAIPDDLKQRVRIIGANCLGLCKENDKHPPFIRVGAKILENASAESVIRELRTMLEEETDEPRQ
jgi:NADH:ubiquinone oxidoreductase subunit E